MQNKLGKQKLWHMYCYFVNSVYFNPTNFKNLYFNIYLIRVHGLKNTSFLYLTSHNVYTVLYDLNITVTGKID